MFYFPKTLFLFKTRQMDGYLYIIDINIWIADVKFKLQLIP